MERKDGFFPFRISLPSLLATLQQQKLGIRSHKVGLEKESLLEQIERGKI